MSDKEGIIQFPKPVQFPDIEVTAEHVVFKDYNLTGQYWRTFSTVLLFNRNGTLHKQSMDSIEEILTYEYHFFMRERPGKDFYSFLEDIRTRSLANVSGLKELMACWDE